MILGAHVSTQGGVENAPANGANLGITAIQIFAKNQRQWVAKPLDPESVERYHEAVADHGITHAVSHASYLINLCAPDPEKLTKSIDSLTDELERAEKLKLSHVVFHPGSHLKEGEEWGLAKIAESIDEIHKRLPGYQSKLTLENTAGQGTNLGSTFEELAAIIERSAHPDRLGVCYDTCHGFAAGHDMRTPEAYAETMARFDRTIGLDRLKWFHVNDTRHELGSRKDRHEHIGQGAITLPGFRNLMQDPRFFDTPMTLETPKEPDLQDDIRTLTALRLLREEIV